jgi:glycosyltransferase involved in cell wall biosynthesis
MPPTVSAIICTFNHRDYVLEALQSVFDQTFANYEVIVVNDGSPDDTGELLRPLVQEGRIRYFEQQNRGQAAARNYGIAQARGEFVAFLDDDDAWPPDKLEWQIETLRQEQDAILVYGSCAFLGAGIESRWPVGDAPSGYVFEHFATGSAGIGSPGQTLIQRTALAQIGGFDEDIWGVDDWELYLRLARLGRFVYRDRVALWYRRHASNASRDFSRMYLNCLKVFNKHLAGRRDISDRVRRQSLRWIRRSWSASAARLGHELIANHQRLEARRAYFWALRHYPSLALDQRVARRTLRSLAPGFMDRLWLAWIERKSDRTPKGIREPANQGCRS